MSNRIIEIIGSTVRNGRIYFPASDVAFFPPDSFSGRSPSGHIGRPITFRVGGRLMETDIRVSSGNRLSPRKTFGFFLKQVKAREGAHLRITRTSDREYEVEYIG